MFEGNLKKQLGAGTRGQGSLHSFRWTDLVARLSAERDFRNECVRQEGVGGFDGFARTRREGQDQDKARLYHAGSTDGKGPDVHAGGAAEEQTVKAIRTGDD